jgi:hypothetical protein
MSLPARIPALDYDAWEPTKATLHLATQIVGKVKLARHPKLAHWWHATLRVTPRGVGTQTIPVPGGSFELEIDVHDLRLNGRNSDGVVSGFDLAGLPIAEVYGRTMRLLDQLGQPTEIVATPYDNPHSTVPFADDHEHDSWDQEAILRWWQALSFVDEVFQSFAGRSFIRTSPVQLFWHSFDLAVTRFTGRRSPSFGEGARRSDVEAYSHEVVSFGWWPGDPDVRFPAFYSYTAPEPDGLSRRGLEPGRAWWQELESSHMALLKWDDVRDDDDPRGTVLAFLQSAWEAAEATLDVPLDGLRTEPLWDDLDERFPATRQREAR